MSSLSFVTRLAVVFALILTGCGSAEPDGASGSEESPATTTETEGSTATTAPLQEDSSDDGDDTQPSTGGEDGSDIDWATVDLTSIDWENIDMRTVDFDAIQDNPTAADITEDMRASILSRVNPGNATLTIGDMTWEFDNLLCAIGTESTESAVYTLTTDTVGDLDGTLVQIQATVRDDSEQGRVEGDDLEHEVLIQDISDFENPAVDWRMRGSDGVTIDGYELTAEGAFDDLLTPEDEALPGMLVGTCGDGSRIP